MGAGAEYHGVFRQKMVSIRMPGGEPTILDLLRVIRVGDNFVEWVTMTDPVARIAEPAQGFGHPVTFWIG